MSGAVDPVPRAVEVVDAPARKKSGEDSSRSHPTLEDVDHLPKFSRRRRSSHNQSHRKVDVHFFDPEGVRELQRTYSRQSQQQSRSQLNVHPNKEDRRSVSTDTTLASQASPFDLEKTL